MDQAIGAAEAGKGTKEGPSLQLSYQLDGEKAEKVDGGYQANYNREESKGMWYLIKRTVKNPHSPSVLKVQRVIEGKTQEYEVQEEVKNAIQRK